MAGGISRIVVLEAKLFAIRDTVAIHDRPDLLAADFVVGLAACLLFHARLSLRGCKPPLASERIRANYGQSQQQLKGGDPVSHCLVSAPTAAAWISDATLRISE